MLEKDARVIPSLPFRLVIHFRFRLSFSNGEVTQMWLARFVGSLGETSHIWNGQHFTLGGIVSYHSRNIGPYLQLWINNLPELNISKQLLRKKPRKLFVSSWLYLFLPVSPRSTVVQLVFNPFSHFISQLELYSQLQLSLWSDPIALGVPNPTQWVLVMIQGAGNLTET